MITNVVRKFYDKNNSLTSCTISPYHEYMKLHTDHHTTARAVLGFLVVVIALAILLLFYQNQDAIILAGNFKTYFFLSVTGFCLLLAVMYFASKPHKSSKKK